MLSPLRHAIISIQIHFYVTSAVFEICYCYCSQARKDNVNPPPTPWEQNLLPTPFCPILMRPL